MTEKEFIVWLKGYFEIVNPKEIGEKETQIIKDHLETFFTKVTPERHEIKIIEDKNIPPDTILTRHPPIFVSKCKGGLGHCGALGCKTCNSPLVATC